MAASAVRDDETYVMVAAIDFGTTYSGYAFAFKNRPSKILMNKNWGEGLGFQCYKTPTSVLTGPDHKFVAFGHEAEKKYSMLSTHSDDEHHMYKHFKMILHQEKHLTMKTTVTSTDGHIRPAMDIFVMAIKYLKNHLLEAVGKEVTSKPDAKSVRWVITVPAIWSDIAKNFMREAAYKAGCIKNKDSRQLVICLEPEAASLYCRQLEVNRFSVAKGIAVDFQKFKANTKYLIIDAGGGTVDITAHEIQFDGSLKELHQANGGLWGGTKVDENFVTLLKKILGADFLNAYKKKCPCNWLTMMGSFETLKREIKQDGKSQIALELSWSMGSEYMEMCKKNIEQVLNESSKHGVSFNNGRIILTHKATMLLFRPIIDQIIVHVKTLLKLPALKSLSYVLLVGGFGESGVLQDAIQSIVPAGTRLLVPSEAQLSVIKGAVNFCQNMNQISSRIARSTFGRKTAVRFVKGKHDEGKKIRLKKEGYVKILCEDTFHVLVKKGDLLEIGHTVSARSQPREPNQEWIEIHVYSTESEELGEVEYVTNPKFKHLGKVNVNSPNIEKGVNRTIELRLEFGWTEIRATAIDLTTGCRAETMINMF